MVLVVVYIFNGFLHALKYYQKRQPLLDLRDQLGHYDVTKKPISSDIANRQEQLRQNKRMKKIVLPTYIAEAPELERKEEGLGDKLNSIKKDIRNSADEIQKLQTLVKVVLSCSDEGRSLGYEGALSSARCLDILLREHGSYVQGLEEFETLAKWVVQVRTLARRWEAMNAELYEIRQEWEKRPEQRALLLQKLSEKQKELESVNRAIVESQENLAAILRQLESRLEATQKKLKMLQEEKKRVEIELDALQRRKASIINEIEQYKEQLGHTSDWKFNMANLVSDAKTVKNIIATLESRARGVDEAIGTLTTRIDLLEKSTKRDFRSLWLRFYFFWGVLSLILQQIGFAFVYRYLHKKCEGSFQLSQHTKGTKWFDYILVPMPLPSQLLVPKTALSRIVVAANKGVFSCVIFMIVGIVPLLLAIVS